MVADNKKEEDKGKIFGVRIDMAQREPYTVGLGSPNYGDDWEYNLWGYFDKMRIKTLSTTEEFSFNENPQSQGRMNSRSKSQTMFLYVKDEDENSRILKEHEKGESKFNFLALIAVKFQRQFISASPCRTEPCISKYLNKVFKENKKSKGEFEFCVMNSLSIDDAYILLATDNPNLILEFVNNVRTHICTFSCPEGDEETKKSNALKIARQKLGKLLEQARTQDSIINEQSELLECAEKCYAYLCEKKPMDINADRLKEIVVPLDAYIEDKMNAYEKAHERQDVSVVKKILYSELSWALECINTIRIFQQLPFILHTHTVIGYKSDLTPEALTFPEEKVNFEMRIHSRPGANIDTMFSDDEGKLFGEMIKLHNGKKPPIVPILGINDYTWRGEFTLNTLMRIYSHNSIDWTNPKYGFAIQYSSGHFIIGQNGDCEAFGEDEKNRTILKESRRLALEDEFISTLWSDEQTEFANELFPEIYKYGEEFGFLLPLIKDIDRLHTLGCRQFFYSSAWKNHKDTSTFFMAFFKRIKSTFEALDKKETETRKNHAMMIAKGLKRVIPLLSEIFEDRLVLDMSMYDNARISRYFTGAYETLLKQYGDWIKSLHGLLVKLDNGKMSEDQLPFLLVPTESDMVFSDNIFPVMSGIRKNNESTLVIHSASFSSMLDIPHTLSIFVHEVAHYTGIVARKSRVMTLFHMTSYFYSVRIARDLCFRVSNYEMTSTVQDIIEKLAESLSDYFEHRYDNDFNDMSGDEVLHSLDSAELLCFEWFNDFLYKQLFRDNIPHYALPLESVFKELYAALGALPHITEKGRYFEMLSEDILPEKFDNLCRTHIRECYADLVMIHVLELNSDDYFHTLLKALAVRDSGLDATVASPEFGGDGNLSVFDAMRALSAILQTEFKEIKHTKNFDFEIDIIKQVPDKTLKIIEDVNQTVLKEHGIVWKSLRKALEQLLLRGDDEKIDAPIHYGKSYDWLCLWRLASVYLYSSGLEIKKKLASESIADFHKDIVNRYKAISELRGAEKTMQQLNLLLHPEGEL